MKKQTQTRIDIRCSEKEKAKLQKLAANRKMTLSEYCRDRLLGRKIVVRYLNTKKEKIINEV